MPLSLVVAGIWLTNGPLGIMASYLLLATAVVSAAISKSWAPVARAAFSALLGGTLAAFYLLPAIWERGWANFGAAVSERAYVIENGWLFSQHADPSWVRQDTSSGHSLVGCGRHVWHQRNCCGDCVEARQADR